MDGASRGLLLYRRAGGRQPEAPGAGDAQGGEDLRAAGDPRQGGGVCRRGGRGEVVGRGQRGRRAAGGSAHQDRPRALRQVAGRREEKVGERD